MEVNEYKFIDAGLNDGFTSADKLVEGKIKTTLLGRRVAELYIDPYTANYLITSMEHSKSGKITALSLIQMCCYTLEMRPFLKVKVKEFDEIEEYMTLHGDEFISIEPKLHEPEHDDYMSSVKTAMMIHDWIDEKDEEFILEKYGIRPGELHYKCSNADWLLYAVAELAKILGMKEFFQTVSKCRVRLKYGAKEELFPLLKLKNIGRTRARKMFRNRIKNLGDIRSIDFTTLAQMLGHKIAVDIKSQVGQDYSKMKVKPKKRKGQVSLLDF